MAVLLNLATLPRVGNVELFAGVLDRKSRYTFLEIQVSQFGSEKVTVLKEGRKLDAAQRKGMREGKKAVPAVGISNRERLIELPNVVSVDFRT